MLCAGMPRLTVARSNRLLLLRTDKHNHQQETYGSIYRHICWPKQRRDTHVRSTIFACASSPMSPQCVGGVTVLLTAQVEKGTQGVDSRVVNPRSKGQKGAARIDALWHISAANAFNSVVQDQNCCHKPKLCRAGPLPTAAALMCVAACSVCCVLVFSDSNRVRHLRAGSTCINQCAAVMTPCPAVLSTPCRPACICHHLDACW